MSGQFELSGRCHCGNIRYQFVSPIPKTELPIRSCDCSFCTKQGAIYTSHPQGKLRVELADTTSTRRYRFGSETAEMLLCSICGVFPLITCTIEGKLYAVLNANSINGLHIDRQRLTPSDYQHLDAEEMLRKRRENWIADVEIVEGRGAAINASFF